MIDTRNNQEKGIICLCVCFSLIIIIYTSLRLRGYYSFNPVVEWDYRYLVEKYLFYGALISSQMGYFYIYGDIERDFNKIIVITILSIIIMDLDAIRNMLSMLIV